MTQISLPAPAKGYRLSALGALFVLTLRQYLRGRRLLVLAIFYLLPVGLAIFGRQLENQTAQFEFVLVLNMIPHTFVPLTALLYASGMVQDEIEEQTLTYLLIRSFSKWNLYLTKLLATYLTAVVVSVFFTALTFLVIHWGSAEPSDALMVRCLKTLTLVAMSVGAYCAIFGLLSLFVQRLLVIGVAYIIVFEGLVGNIGFAVRGLTVVYYFRTLAARWLDLAPWQINDWSLQLDTAPSAGQCVMILLITSLLTSGLAALVFTGREFRMKTPEGN